MNPDNWGNKMLPWLHVSSSSLNIYVLIWLISRLDFVLILCFLWVFFLHFIVWPLTIFCRESSGAKENKQRILSSCKQPSVSSMRYLIIYYLRSCRLLPNMVEHWWWHQRGQFSKWDVFKLWWPNTEDYWVCVLKIL